MIFLMSYTFIDFFTCDLFSISTTVTNRHEGNGVIKRPVLKTSNTRLENNNTITSNNAMSWKIIHQVALRIYRQHKYMDCGE